MQKDALELIMWIGAILTSYLVGSIPTGYIFGRLMKGLDIRQYGSGNVGASNVMRVLGKKYGILTLLLDAAKGIAAVWVIGPLWGCAMLDFSNIQLASGIASIAGHNWTCFLNFKGGKGVATSAGVFLALAPLVTLCLLAVWSLVAYLFRYVSLASMAASAALPIFLYIFHRPTSWVIAGFFLLCVSIWKHRANIQRLLEGKEHKIGEKVKT